ncbi:MAG: cold shock domain-containing protein [Flavobacteriales bacterium]|jgi:cold shock CspA family protein|nr:cold shock domain-containing protein [Flavobacteriales bacterium]
MAKSQQTFNKSEKEKKRLKKRDDKAKKKAARRLGIEETGGENEFVYVDHLGNLTETPPDPSMKIEIEADSIEIGIPKQLESEKEDPIRKGKVSFYDSSKGFGFIIDLDNQEKYFTHVSGIIDEIAEDDKVTFELEKGLKGLNAVRVKKV